MKGREQEGEEVIGREGEGKRGQGAKERERGAPPLGGAARNDKGESSV